MRKPLLRPLAQGQRGKPSVRSHPAMSAGAPRVVVMDVALSDRDLALLALERDFVGRPAAKARAIRNSLALSPVRYYQLLFALIEEPAALGHDPLLVRRLQRVRDSRLRERRLRPAEETPGP